jgi:hypothetical protein
MADLSPSSLPDSHSREFGFNIGSSFAFFLDEDGIYSYRLQIKWQNILEVLIFAAFLLPALVLVDLFLISPYILIDITLAGLTASTVFRVVMVKRKKMARGSSRTEWEQSGAKRRFYDWSQGKLARLKKSGALTRGRGYIGLKLGSATWLAARYDEIDDQELRFFLSEKLGERLKSP